VRTARLTDVDADKRTSCCSRRGARDVLNVVPPQKADRIAELAGVITANNRWCEVDWLSCESKAQHNIHVLGDATLSAPLMPKSATWRTSTASCARRR